MTVDILMLYSCTGTICVGRGASPINNGVQEHMGVNRN